MKILLTTLHAKYIHASLALPYLHATTIDIPGIQSVIREFTINESRTGILREIVAEEADLVAFSCYIWNIELVARLAADLKKVKPGTILIAGGPEISYTAEEFLRENSSFDFVVCGEGEKTWQELLSCLIRKDVSSSKECALPPGLAYRNESGIAVTQDQEPIENLDDIPSPFTLGLVDTTKPLVYYETSRGCPFSCAFCLSSRETGVRTFSKDRIRSDISYLIQQEVKVVKLVDRTFNYNASRANEIWNFILTHNRTSTFHFEIAADLLTDENFRTLSRIPAGMFRFEIGVQAIGKETLSRVGRSSDPDRLLANVKRLREETAITVHLDLVAGLPGENFKGFLASLDRLFPVNPYHIQVEPLKVLKGSPMVEIAQQEDYAFSVTPPYTILRTPDLRFDEIGHIEDIARLLDLYFNSGRFSQTLTAAKFNFSLADFFDAMAHFIKKEPVHGQVSLKNLFEQLWRFGLETLPAKTANLFREALCYDFCLSDYPSTGTQPSFFPGEWKDLRDSLPRQAIDAAMAKVYKPTGSRVRTYAASFSHDFRTSPPKPGRIDLIFIYVSAPGEGLRVESVAAPPAAE